MFMENNLPLGAELNSFAPWHEEIVYCKECGSDMTIWDIGDGWKDYKCETCDYITNNEPDCD